MFKKFESGRSMVEMLGVLAIIGVLSIGGIAGYTLAMRKHRANQVLDIVNKYAMIVNSACSQHWKKGGPGEPVYCPYDKLLSFEDSGLTSVPDIKTISPSNTVPHRTVIYVEFHDKAICKAVRQYTASVGSAEICPDNWLIIPVMHESGKKPYPFN